jgi:hypothetical protein
MVVCAFDVVGLCTVLLGCGEFVYILAVWGASAGEACPAPGITAKIVRQVRTA